MLGSLYLEVAFAEIDKIEQKEAYAISKMAD